MDIKITKKQTIKFIDSLTLQQKQVLIWMARAHEGQKRKYTGKPYFMHPLEVAILASRFDKRFGVIEVAFLHDVDEDTEENIETIAWMLAGAGYTKDQALEILRGIISMTDVFTHEKFPKMNRFQRKTREAHRLGRIDEKWQGVKYADLINNTKSIVKHDLEFAITYLKEKDYALRQMRFGNEILYAGAWRVLRKGLDKIAKEMKKSA